MHPANRNERIFPGEDIRVYDSSISYQNLDGFMIGRASFGNPWCFLPDGRRPTLQEVLSTMELHAKLLIETKGPKGALEIRKHLVQYLHGFPGVKEYRSRLVHTETLEDVYSVTADIRVAHAPNLEKPMLSDGGTAFSEAWDGYAG